MHVQLGQIMDKIQMINTLTTALATHGHFWRAGSKKSVSRKTQRLRMRPALNTAKGESDHLSHPPTLPLDTSLPSPHIRSKLSLFSRSEQGRLVYSCSPLVYNRSPNKALPEFLVWSGINFYWLGKAKNAGGSYRKEWGLFMNLRFPSFMWPHRSQDICWCLSTQPTHPPGSAQTLPIGRLIYVWYVWLQSWRGLGQRVIPFLKGLENKYERKEQ